MSPQQLMLLAVVRNKTLCQAPLPWCHNAIPWWCDIGNITSFWKFELDMLSDIKTADKYWSNFVVLTSQDKNKTVRSAWQPLTPLGRSGGPNDIPTQFYCYISWTEFIQSFQNFSGSLTVLSCTSYWSNFLEFLYWTTAVLSCFVQISVVMS